jgi:hypothetical protein
MRKVLLYLLLLQIGMLLSTRTPAKENLPLEGTEWTDLWVAHADQNDLPRVLMVGDSIAQGYFRDVEKDLTGKAYCAKYATSIFLASPDYLNELKIILNRYRFSVIHINNGLHGWKYTEEQYRQSLPKLMATLTKYGKGAVIIWATSTPRRNAQIPAQLATDNGRVMERNRIAVEYMNQHGIAVDVLRQGSGQALIALRRAAVVVDHADQVHAVAFAGVQGMAPWVHRDLAISAAPSNQKTLSTSASVLASSGMVSAPDLWRRCVGHASQRRGDFRHPLVSSTAQSGMAGALRRGMPASRNSFIMSDGQNSKISCRVAFGA